MQKNNKLIQKHGLQKQKTPNPMFGNIKNRITNQLPKNSSQMSQSNVQSSMKSIVDSQNQIKSQLTVPQSNHKRSDSKDMPKRLKLKDYIRLNQISKQKKSRSVQSLKISSNQKLNVSQKAELKATFGNQKSEQSIGISGSLNKKALKSYSQQIQIQRSQLANTIRKTKQRFSKIMDLIEETNNSFTDYNDLVFMFKLQESINEYFNKGIQQISNSFSDHFVEKNDEGVDKMQILKKLSNISPSKQGLLLLKSSVAKALQKTYEQQNNQIQLNTFRILPVSCQPYIKSFDSNHQDSNQSNSIPQQSQNN